MTRAEETALWASLYAEGLSLLQIAQRQGCQKTTVRDRLHAAGVTLRPRGGYHGKGGRSAGPPGGPRGRAKNAAVTREEEARMIQLHVHEGRPLGEVAAAVGRNHQTVSRVLSRLGQLRGRAAVLAEVPAAMREHIPAACNLAKVTLGRLALPVTAEYDEQDWYSVARLIALKALASYRPEKGAAWSSWVICRVRWDLINELRRTAPYTRREWATLREDFFAAEPEIPAPLRQGEWEVRARELCRGRHQVSWEQWCAEWDGDEEDWSPHRVPDWLTAPDPRDWLLARAVRDAVAALPARLREVVRRHQQGYAGKEIAQAMGISESRVCQLHEEGRQRLREVLAEWA